jgi:hypothetical protein
MSNFANLTGGALNILNNSIYSFSPICLFYNNSALKNGGALFL